MWFCTMNTYHLPWFNIVGLASIASWNVKETHCSCAALIKSWNDKTFLSLSKTSCHWKFNAFYSCHLAKSMSRSTKNVVHNRIKGWWNSIILCCCEPWSCIAFLESRCSIALANVDHFFSFKLLSIQIFTSAIYLL